MEAKIKEFIEAKYPALIPLIKIKCMHFTGIVARVSMLDREFILDENIDKYPTFTQYLDETLRIIQQHKYVIYINPYDDIFLKCPTLAPFIDFMNTRTVEYYPIYVLIERDNNNNHPIGDLDNLRAFDEVVVNVIRMKKEALRPLPMPIANEISQYIW